MTSDRMRNGPRKMARTSCCIRLAMMVLPAFSILNLQEEEKDSSAADE